MQNYSQWHTEDRFPDAVRGGDAMSGIVGHPQQLRSPLGQLIERSSTSPIRTTMIESLESGSMVGNDLLEYVTNGYSDITLNRSRPQRHASTGMVENRKGSGSATTATVESFERRASLNIDDYSLAQQSAASMGSDFFPLHTADREGGAVAAHAGFGDDVTRSAVISSETSVDGSLSPFLSMDSDARYRGFMDSGRGSSGADLDLQRSRSAAPFLPTRGPGTTFGSALQDTLAAPFEHRAGPNGSAHLRDVPIGPLVRNHLDYHDESDFLHRRSSSNGLPLYSSNGVVRDHQLQDRRSLSPSDKVPDNGMGSPLTPHQTKTRNHSQFHMDEFAVGSIPTYQHEGSRSHHQQHQALGGSVSPGYRQANSGDSPMYIQHQASQHLHVTTGQSFQQQPVFLANDVQSHGSQPQTIQLQDLQVQVLPNGQTVLVRTSSAPQQSYGNGTILYPTQQHQHSQLHRNGAGGQREEYVSLIPIQRGGQQVSYWQQGDSSQPSLYPTNGLISPGSGPIILDGLRDSGGSAADYHAAARARDLKNGRGRRGNTRGRGGDGKSLVSSSSMLLEEFRTSKSRDWTVRRIEGHVVEFCQDQNGSRFIQQRLEMGDMGEQQVVMKEVLPAIRRLRNDVFGNYVVQKLLDFGSPKTKSDIRDTLEGEILPLSLQMYGCRVVQKALETLDEDDLPRILREFHHNVLSCIQDQNGNHVIQKCIEVLNSRARKAASGGDSHRAKFLSEQVDFILDDVLANTTLLSCHPYGCRVLQRILEHCVEKKKMALLDEIKKCHKTLLDDQYGNYVIQHVLQYGRDEDRDSIVQIVVENGLLGLSRQKFASNVVEKLLKYGNGDQRRAIVREMLKYADDSSLPLEPSDGHTVVVLLMVRDAYANYVVQTTLDVCPESNEKRMLLQELNSHADELRNYTFAKHIVAKLHSMNEANQHNTN